MSHQLKSTEADHSPLSASYEQYFPEDYGEPLCELGYNPKINELPPYCTTLLDCGSSFGSSTMMSSYGWTFEQVNKYWRTKEPLTEEFRSKTLLNRRINTIGLDLHYGPLDFGKRMNIYDSFCQQDFSKQLTEESRAALIAADCIIFQHCITYCPLEQLIEWIDVYVADRSRPKRLIYDYNPFFDPRDLRPEVILAHIPHWMDVKSQQAYRDKTDEEFEKNTTGGRKLVVEHVMVDFA